MSEPDPTKIVQTLRDYAQYSPEFQLELLGLDGESLRNPILDLGCGEDAALVHYFREQLGREAFGIDLRAEDTTSYIMQADWLTFPLEPEKWGTILSHQGYSNHFINHHLRKNGRPERYARRYLTILRALVPGGSFSYAPGLPFFEPLLPSELFRIDRRLVTELEGSDFGRVLRGRVGADVLYAACVTKLPSR